MHQGIFIAIEGSDGSGKTTQFKLLVERLKADGYEVETVKFPRYQEGSSYFIRKYLRGDYGDAEALGPYTPSLFYALDRFDQSGQIKGWLQEGKIVVADRYVSSNKAHQGQKLDNAEHRAAYYQWIDQLEFDMLGSPQPDLNVVLTVPAEVATQLIKTRSATHTPDQHDNNPEHLSRATEAYKELCRLYPQTFAHIECSNKGEMMSVSAINNLIWERIQPMFGRLRKKHGSDDSDNSGSEGKAPDQPEISSNSSEAILAKHQELIKQTLQKLRQLGASHEVIELVQLTKVPNITTTLFVYHKKGIDLPPLKGDDTQPAILMDRWPKNEFDTIALALYPTSTLTFAALAQTISNWSYTEKENELKKYLQSDDRIPARYTIELLTSCILFNHLEYKGEVIRQLINPFYGYDDTFTTDNTETEGLIEDCFNSSLKTYQALQSAGLVDQAERACLAGHKFRWQTTLTYTQLKDLLRQLNECATPESIKVREHLLATLAEFHPLVAAHLTSDNKV